MRRRGRRRAGWWVVLVSLYLVFISTVTLLEFAVGAAGAVLASCGAHGVRRASRKGRR